MIFFFKSSCLKKIQAILKSKDFQRLGLDSQSNIFTSISLPLPSYLFHSFPATSLCVPPGSKRNLLQTICLSVQHMPPLVTREKEKDMWGHNRTITGANSLHSSFSSSLLYLSRCQSSTSWGATNTKLC